MRNRNIISLVVLIMLALIGRTWADAGLTLSGNPLGILYITGPSIEFEAGVSGEHALAGRIHFTPERPVTTTIDASGAGGGLSYRYFFMNKKEVPRGLWAGPAVDILSVGLNDDTGASETVLFYSAGLEVGYKWVMGEGLALALAPFMLFQYSNLDSKVFRDEYYINRFEVGFGLSVGMAF